MMFQLWDQQGGLDVELGVVVGGFVRLGAVSSIIPIVLAI